MARLQSWFKNKKISAAQRGNKHDKTVNESRRQPSTGQKKKPKPIGRFKLFLPRGANVVHKFLCMCSIVCVHIIYMVIIVHGICEGLSNEKL